MRKIEPLPRPQQAVMPALQDDELDAVTGGVVFDLIAPRVDGSALTYELERCFVKSWSTSGDA